MIISVLKGIIMVQVYESVLTAPLTEKEKAEQALIDCLANTARLKDRDINIMMSLMDIKTFQKGTFLLKEGQVATTCYYNHKGCVREYYLKDGEEKTTMFYLEDEPISSMLSSTRKIPSRHYLECAEETTLAIMSQEAEAEMFARYPELESACRVEMERRLGNYQEILATYITLSPEERYLNLLNNRPELLHRVPQYQLASFLGIKPESLSRIRKRIKQNAR